MFDFGASHNESAMKAARNRDCQFSPSVPRPGPGAIAVKEPPNQSLIRYVSRQSGKVGYNDTGNCFVMLPAIREHLLKLRTLCGCTGRLFVNEDLQ